MDKIALVTGGSRGIGREISIKLAKANYKVIINYLANAAAAEETLKLCNEQGLIVQADVSSQEGINKLQTTIKQEYGKLDLLVNNAGITRDNLLIRMSLEEWQQVIQTNLLGVMELTDCLLPLLEKSANGKIINITSTVGVHGNAGQFNYAAAKSALIGFTKLKARELMPKIQVNAIAPGLVETDMTAKFDLDKLAETKLGRAAKPADIANCIMWLTENSYVTGQTIEIDGGLFLWSGIEALV
jgi:3-oxoacyl-[acyl-carrier protein] reductase